MSEKTGSTASAFRSAFEVLDGDGDGKISREDLKMFSKIAFPSGFDDEIIGTMISLANSNDNGFVEYEDFERVLGLSSKSKQMASSSCFEVMGDVFKVMDQDGDVKLSHEDLKSYTEWVGLSFSDEDINGMIILGGAGSGSCGENEVVSFNGLLKILGVDFVGL